VLPLKPYSNSLDVGPSATQQLDFIWSLKGVDSWETPLVQLVLASSLLEMDMAFPLYSTSETQFSYPYQGACPADSVCPFWWKLIASVHSVFTPSAIDTAISPVQFFQTRRATNLVQMKVNLSSNAIKIGTGTWVHSQNTADQTEVIWNVDSSSRAAISPFMVAGTWRVIAGDSLHSEIAVDSLTLILTPGVFHNIGSVLELNDVVPPQIQLTSIANPNLRNDSLVFEILDFGCGLDTTTISVSAPNMKVTIVGNKVTLSWTSLNATNLPMQIRITAKDFAKNSSETSFFKTQISSDYFVLLGPYFDPIVPAGTP
jgi:alpha-glucosidase (family GH31 glycosyl hydrolase)